MKKGQVYEGIVEKVSFPNKCVVAVEGEEKKVIVKNALPGQKVRFRLSKARKGKCEGNLLEVLEPSPVELRGSDIPCAHFGACGGCSYQHLSYEDQLALKEKQIRELLAPVLAEEGSDFDALFEGILPSPRQFGYRNKMEFSFGDTLKGGDLALGMHKRGSFYDIVTVSDCRIVDEDFRKILTAVLNYFSERHVSYFHKNTHEGYLRHLLVRKAAKTGEILVDLVTTAQTECENRDARRVDADRTGVDTLRLDEQAEDVGTDAGRMETAARSADDEPDLVAVAFYHAQARVKGTSVWEETLLAGLVETLRRLGLDGRIAGILHTRNDSVADVVKDEGTDILYGEDFFYEELLGLRFKISPFSFFQTNSPGAEVLYETAREYVGNLRQRDDEGIASGPQARQVPETDRDADDSFTDDGSAGDGAVVFDLYSGTGTIAQMLAPVTKKVIGVEIVEEAVEAARENAALNGCSNCEFLAGDVLKVLDTIVEKPDFIVLDPPRDGIHPKALEKIIDYGVERMVYISCKPTSLARDLEVLQARGYRVERVRCVDMFPGTVHTETICLLTRIK